MLNPQIRQNVKRIKLVTKRMMHSTLSGDYLAAFKGTGLEFHQIRSYQLGDDVRSIDWKSSAKMGGLMVKEFIEDRERSLIIALDTSASQAYGSGAALKHESAQDLAAALACVAHENKDNVGLVLFGATVHTTLPTKKGAAHLNAVLEKIYATPATGSTDFAALIAYLLKAPKKNMVLAIISDWIVADEKQLRHLAAISKLYDVIALQVIDPCEEQLPDVGLIELRDPETGEQVLVKAASINQLLRERQIAQKRLFDRHRISALRITAGAPFIPPLARFLQYRSKK